MERKYTVSCYTLMQPAIPRMKFIQNDTNTSKIEFNLYDDANDPMLDITDASITIERSDGFTVSYGVGADITITDNVILFTLPPSALSIDGQVSASLHAYNGLNRLTMANFRYYVTAEVSNSNPIEGDEHYPVLTDLINRVNDAVDSFATSGMSIVDAEVIDARKGMANLRAKIDELDNNKYITDASTGYKYYTVIENGALIYRRLV